MKILFIILTYIFLFSVEHSIYATEACICQHGCYLWNGCFLSQCEQRCLKNNRGSAAPNSCTSDEGNQETNRFECMRYNQDLSFYGKTEELYSSYIPTTPTSPDRRGTQRILPGKHTLGLDFIIGPEPSTLAAGDKTDLMLRALQIPKGTNWQSECDEIFGTNRWDGLANVAWRFEKVNTLCLDKAPDIRDALADSVCSVLKLYRSQYVYDDLTPNERKPNKLWFMINAGSKNFARLKPRDRFREPSNVWNQFGEPINLWDYSGRPIKVLDKFGEPINVWNQLKYPVPEREGNWSYVFKFNDICGEKLFE